MEQWLRISLILCTFGFFREFRPSEPFVSDFLTGEWRNVTEDQVNFEVYPIGTYSTLGLLVIVFLITDILRYKPIIIASSVAGIIIWSILLWTTSLFALQVSQFFYGFYFAAEVAYYTYMYAKVEKAQYQKVTGNARAAILTGRFSASVCAQALYSFGIMNLRDLNYLTLGAQTISLFVGFALPSVGRSLYFYSVPKHDTYDSSYGTDNSTHSDTKKEFKSRFSTRKATSLLWTHFLDSYSNPTVVQWSFWWALAMGGFFLVQFYVQILWMAVEDRDHLLNAGVEAILTALGALSAFLAGFLTSKTFRKYDMWVLTVCSLLQGIMIVILSQTNQIYVAYSMYIIFGVIFSFMITLATAFVAQELADDSFALIFGINTLIALIFQTIITLIVMTWLNLNIRLQYLIFGCYFIALSVIYLIASVIKMIFYKDSAVQQISE
ncbi:thiamine transporter 1-like [Chironomus tepperi]|uniref:thiamine transporter 1-like n=1 Tax=Chironomus tepperi TaxID=113505 RepID=UPI00391F27E1